MTTERESEILKKNQEIKDRLHSGRQEVILETIKKLRHSGNRDIIPEIIDLISSDFSDEVTNACAGLLNDLKDKKSAGMIPEAILQNRHRKNLDRIVASCWQNGLDYSPYIDLFIDLVIEEDFMTALESFSVVEQNIHALSVEEREIKAAYLQGRISETDSEKSLLVRGTHPHNKDFPGTFPH